MATRYTGNLTLRVTLEDDDTFTTRIAVDGRHAATLRGQQLPRAWRGAIDSPRAYDEVAQAAIDFAGAGLHEPSEGFEAYERPDPIEAAHGYYDSDPDTGESLVFRSKRAMR